MAVSFKGAHFPQEIILIGICWYLAYPLSTRHVEELMLERGVYVDHSTINRWVIKYSPQLETAFHRRKRAVWISWQMDETYIKVEFITIKSLAATGSAVPGSCAGHSRVPSPDRGPPASTGGSGLSQCDNA